MNRRYWLGDLGVGEGIILKWVLIRASEYGLNSPD
jgi:hypothetical protein